MIEKVDFKPNKLITAEIHRLEDEGSKEFGDRVEVETSEECSSCKLKSIFTSPHGAPLVSCGGFTFEPNNITNFSQSVQVVAEISIENPAILQNYKHLVQNEASCHFPANKIK